MLRLLIIYYVSNRYCDFNCPFSFSKSSLLLFEFVYPQTLLLVSYHYKPAQQHAQLFFANLSETGTGLHESSPFIRTERSEDRATYESQKMGRSWGRLECPAFGDGRIRASWIKSNFSPLNVTNALQYSSTLGKHGMGNGLSHLGVL